MQRRRDGLAGSNRGEWHGRPSRQSGDREVIMGREADDLLGPEDRFAFPTTAGEIENAYADDAPLAVLLCRWPRAGYRAPAIGVHQSPLATFFVRRLHWTRYPSKHEGRSAQGRRKRLVPLAPEGRGMSTITVAPSPSRNVEAPAASAKAACCSTPLRATRWSRPR